jgi:hypothetical protein
MKTEDQKTIELKWIKQDLKTALANSPSPLNCAIAAIHDGIARIVGIIEQKNSKQFCVNLPEKQFILWDGNEFSEINFER